MCSLVVGRGKGPKWPLTLYAGSEDAVIEALRPIEAVSTYLRGDVGQVTLVITPYVDVDPQPCKVSASCAIEVRQRRTGGSLMELAPPSGGDHLCVVVGMVIGSQEKFVLSMKGCAYPIRQDLAAHGCAREEQADGTWVRAGAETVEDPRLQGLLRFLKGTFFTCSFSAQVPEKIRCLF